MIDIDIDDHLGAGGPYRRWLTGVAVLAAAALVAACSPAETAKAPEPVALAPGAMQTLVTAHAHMMGEAPRYGHATWERLADADGAAVFRLEPGQAPTVKATLDGERITRIDQQGVLTRQSLAALAAAAGSAPGRHGPTAIEIERAIAKARETAEETTVVVDGVAYAAAPSGDRISAILGP